MKALQIGIFSSIQALVSAMQEKWIWSWLNEQAVNCQSSYSWWVFSQQPSLFVYSPHAVQSYSKWIICHLERIVSDQMIGCTSAGPTPAVNLCWTPPSSLPLPSFSEFAPHGPSLVGKLITPPMRRSKANIHFWTGTNTHTHTHALEPEWEPFVKVTLKHTQWLEEKMK